MMMAISESRGFGLVGARALIVGGGGGLGSAMAAGLHEAGTNVVLMGRSASMLADVSRRISDPDRPVRVVVADAADRRALAAGFEEAVDLLGGLEILIAAQGIALPSQAISHDLEAWDRTLETNLTSVFELCQSAARAMAPAGRGKIITIASMLSFSGGLNVAAYAASKGGVAQLTKALANEWAPLGINVNAIAPGYIKTAANRHIWHDDPGRTAEILARLPAGRWGEPSDVVGPTLFLCSSASDYLHGVILPVDGGWLSR